jgi:hypothetical protein
VWQLPLGDFRSSISNQRCDATRPSSLFNPQSQIRNPQFPWSIDDLRLPIFDWRFRPLRTAEFFNRQSKISNRQWAAVRMKLVGANPSPEIEGLDRLPGISNYFIGNDPKKWRTNIPNYARVRYRDVYPSIDLVYYGKQGQLEYDLVVAPGADPSAINLAYEGVEKMHIDSQGDLVLQAAGREIRQHKPRIYQEIKEGRQAIAGNYVVKEDRQVALELSGYDVGKTLIIDPALSYSTYLGGGFGNAISIDSAGSAYVFGQINTPGFPTSPGALQPTYNEGFCDSVVGHPCSDTFVAKLSPQGDSLVYATYFGGHSDEAAGHIAVDSQGAAYLAGATYSSDFPKTPGVFQPALKSGTCAFGSDPCPDAFVAKLGPQGNTLLYSTYLGGSKEDYAWGIALDAAGNAYVSGSTGSTDFPIATTSHHMFGDSTGAFVVRLDAAGAVLLYSVIIGGSDGSAIAVDGTGSAYVAGSTFSKSFPTVNAFQPACGTTACVNLQCCSNASVSKIDSIGSSLVYSTYLGGNQVDSASAIALDSLGNVYVTGRTSSTNFPTLNPLQPENHGGDAFVTKLNSAGTGLVFSTYLGGDYGDSGTGVAVDPAGNVYVTGATESRDFPVMKLFQAALGGGLGGGRNAFVAKFNPEGTALLYSSYLGGSSVDEARGIGLDSSGNAYVTGYANSTDFPAVNPIQSVTGGAFVAKIFDAATSYVPASFFVPIVLSASGLNNSFFTSELTLTNRGAKDANVEFDYTAAFGGGSGKASDTLSAGRQRIVSDAIEYLRTLGIPIPDSGDRGGTLNVVFSNLVTYSDVAVTVRTTTKEPEGRAGLAYQGVPIWNTLTGPSYLCGLRQNATDRSNVAIQNAGTEVDGDVSLRLTVYSGNPAVPIVKTLPDEKLSPGGFKQFSGILQSNGLSLTNGYVRVERVAGNAPYYAYAVINDQTTSDGSFIPPLYPFDKSLGVFRTLPAVVETNSFASEVLLTSLSPKHSTLDCSYTLSPSNQTVTFSIELNAGEQLIIPNFVDYLRNRGIAGIGPTGVDYVGPLTVNLNNGLTNDIFVGARTSTPGDGGRYGVFYVAQPYYATANSTWIYGLQQNSENRSNVAIVNPNESGPSVFDIDILDGETGLKVKTVQEINLSSPAWLQINSLLAQYAPQVTQGYARVIRRTGAQYFISYGVTNDGGQPGERTGDGAFISSVP